MYSVKQLADLGGVTRRTLHYYDEIDLLSPSLVGENGYRYYDEASLFRLQQILLYREMDLSLEQIKDVLDKPGFDLVSALQQHRSTLTKKIGRLKKLVQTVDNSIMHLTGEIKMSKQNIFDGFEAEKYEQEAVDAWGESVKESTKLWNSYSRDQQEKILQEGNDIYHAIAAEMQKGAASTEVQRLLKKWHQHLRYFYEPSIETLGGLGQMYHDHEDFNATFSKIDPTLPGFLKEAIAVYVDELETK
jgi:DNA-binding transcriptional MerR regulator